MSINVRLENTVRAFLSGFTKPVKEPTKEKHLINIQGVSEHLPVCIGTWNMITHHVTIPSDVASACALQGVRARDIYDLIMTMVLDVEGLEKDVPAAHFDMTVKGVEAPVVCSLGAVYEACNYLITRKIICNYRLMKDRPKKPKKRNAVNKTIH